MVSDVSPAPITRGRTGLPGAGLLKRVLSLGFGQKKAASIDNLTESHYRDLGLPSRRHDAIDPRPLIRLGPM